MKKVLQLCFLTALLSTSAAQVSFAREILIHNDCTFPLTGLYLSMTDSDKAYSMLEAPLSPHEAIKVDMKETGSNWNIIAQDAHGGKVTFENINFEKINQIHIKGDGTVEIYR